MNDLHLIQRRGIDPLLLRKYLLRGVFSLQFPILGEVVVVFGVEWLRHFFPPRAPSGFVFRGCLRQLLHLLNSHTSLFMSETYINSKLLATFEQIKILRGITYMVKYLMCHPRVIMGQVLELLVHAVHFDVQVIYEAEAAL